ncbi:Probable endopeptidase Spr precursor [Serratia rubidaea]|nr:Probable endopeptidase Spr precursor [Serratia rubidaea]VEA68618.1 Probable endopeptidase Spr precursor [Serratia rubidaea]VTP64928.1 Probable endopeptidase Spr precursor [Serratia rubidaea]
MHAVNDKGGLLLQASQDEFEAMVRNVDIKSKILDQYADWKGVRYRLGGESKRGIDCSAFVQRTFREQFGMDLPRSTYQQEDMGKKVQRSKLRPGDLVLFRSGSTGRHVGIYLGNDQFVHASTSNGVMISKLTNVYWNKRYHEARRVLTNNS